MDSISITTVTQCLHIAVVGLPTKSTQLWCKTFRLTLLPLILSWSLRCAVTTTDYGGPLVDGCVLTAAARANNGEQLALADGFGRVRLLRYPAVNDDQVSES